MKNKKINIIDEELEELKKDTRKSPFYSGFPPKPKHNTNGLRLRFKPIPNTKYDFNSLKGRKYLTKIIRQERKKAYDEGIKDEKEILNAYWKGKIQSLLKKAVLVTYKKDGGHGLAIPNAYIIDLEYKLKLNKHERH
jgi:hypothetical protein